MSSARGTFPGFLIGCLVGQTLLTGLLLANHLGSSTGTLFANPDQNSVRVVVGDAPADSDANTTQELILKFSNSQAVATVPRDSDIVGFVNPSATEPRSRPTAIKQAIATFSILIGQGDRGRQLMSRIGVPLLFH